MTSKKDSKVLLLGSSGKMGTALRNVFGPDHYVVCRNSSNFNASDIEQVRSEIEKHTPDIVLNTVAFLGIDQCEKEPQKAFQLNALYPKYLAELSREKDFLLVHFSSDAVFNDVKQNYYVESDVPNPINQYGRSKYEGDCFVQTIAEKYYLIRISILFGDTTKNSQFVEKMLWKINEGTSELKIADDIILSPTYSEDVAREIKRLVGTSSPYGLYHVVNEGRASLYEFMKEIIDNLKLDVTVHKASHRDFPALGIKNTCTPLASEKTSSLRPWKQAVKAYCENLAGAKRS